MLVPDWRRLHHIPASCCSSGSHRFPPMTREVEVMESCLPLAEAARGTSERRSGPLIARGQGHVCHARISTAIALKVFTLKQPVTGLGLIVGS
jgi:hypothetical protein